MNSNIWPSPNVCLHFPFIKIQAFGLEIALIQHNFIPTWLHLQRHYFQTMETQSVRNPPVMQRTQIQSLSWEDPLEKEMATNSSTLAWKIPWTEEPGRLQSMESQTVGQGIAESMQVGLWKWFKSRTLQHTKCPHWGSISLFYRAWVQWETPYKKGSMNKQEMLHTIFPWGVQFTLM